MLIQGDSDNWNPYYGQVGILAALRHKPLWREFTKKGYVRFTDAGEPYWWFETRGIQQLVFKSLGLRFAEENSAQFNKMNREIKNDARLSRWREHKEKWMSIVENDIYLLRRRAELKQVARVRRARKLGLIA